MGNDTESYRSAIGCFSRRKSIKKMIFFETRTTTSGFDTREGIKNILYLIFMSLFLMSICNDIHANPGPGHDTKVRICNLNVRSIHCDQRMSLVRRELAASFDIITVTESWLKSKHSNCDLVIQSFAGPFRQDRHPEPCGGIIAWVRQTMITKRMKCLEKDNLEAMWLQIQAGKDKFFLATCYRQSRGNYAPHFWPELQASYKLALNQGIRDIILVGDFNADISSNTEAGKQLDIFLSTNNLFQHITEPTRIVDDGEGTKLDLLITNHRNVVLKTESLDRLHTNDHNTISGLLQFKTHKALAYTRQMWDFGKANFDNFREEIGRAHV
jgi:hypothetical protein